MAESQAGTCRVMRRAGRTIMRRSSYAWALRHATFGRHPGLDMMRFQLVFARTWCRSIHSNDVLCCDGALLGCHSQADSDIDFLPLSWW